MSSTGRSATRSMGAGRSTTTRAAARPGHLHRLREAIRRRTPLRSTRRSRSAWMWAAQATTTTGRPTSCSSRPSRDSRRASSATTTTCKPRAARATRTSCSTPSRDTNSDPSDPGNPYDWAVRAADYESLLTQYLGAAGKNVQLLATEFNSVYSNPGKQTTSLVNGLFAGRLARRVARDALRRRRCLGPAGTALTRATTIRRASTAGAREATTA